MFRPFTFNIVIEMIGFKASLLFFILSSFSFSLSFVLIKYLMNIFVSFGLLIRNIVLLYAS